MSGSSPLTRSGRSLLFRASSVAGTVVTQALLGRGLGPGTFGTYGVIVANVQIGGQLADFGGELATTRQMAAGSGPLEDLLRRLISLRLLSGGVGFGALCLALLLVGPAPAIRVAIVVGAICVPLTALGAGRALLVAERRFDRAQAALVVQAYLVLAAVSIAWATKELSLLVALVAIAGGAVVGGGLISTWSQWSGWGRSPDPKGAWALARTSIPLAGSTVLAMIALKMPATLVLSSLGAGAAGFYYAAYRFLDVVHILPQNILPNIFPSLVELSPEQPAGLDYFQKLGSGLVIGGAWMTAAFALGGPAMLQVLYGHAFSEAASVIVTLGWAVPMVFVAYAQGNVLVARGRYSDQLRVSAVRALTTALLYPVLCATLGLLGAGLAAVWCETAAAATGAVLVWRRFRVPPLNVRGALGMAGPWLLASAAVLFPVRSALLAIVLASGCGVLALLSLWRMLAVLSAADEQRIATGNNGGR